MRRSRANWWIAGTLCAVGLIATAQGAQQAEEKSESKQTQTQDSNSEKAQQPRNRSQQQQETSVLLGVQIVESSTTGVYVQDVMPQSAADRSGIRARDYILSIDGTKIASPEDFDEAMRKFHPDDEAEFTLWRNRNKQTVQVSFTDTDGQRVARRPDYSQLEGQRNQQSPENRQNNREAWLGVRLGNGRGENASNDNATNPQGVMIMGVYPSGPAARAGIYSGDIVTQVDGKEVTTPEQFAKLIRNHSPNETVKLTMKRDDGEATANATLGDREDFTVSMADAPQPEGRAYTGDYMDEDVSEHAMMLEQHRRFAEQHERIEDRLEEVLNEVRSLRKELDDRKQQE